MEAGTPLYLIDFGVESLPHETGLLEDRVYFKKGCYLGQEVVARMQSLGHPKQKLVALLLDRPTGAMGAPKAGDRVHLAEKADADAVGVVTSGAISPKMGGAAICFAQVRFAHTAPGTRLAVETDGGRAAGAVQSQLSFWKRGA
jgi:folate-binding protein YgfZ